MFFTPEKKVFAKVIGDSLEGNPHHVKVGSTVEIGLKVDPMHLLTRDTSLVELERASKLFSQGIVDVQSNTVNTNLDSLIPTMAKDLDEEELEAFKDLWEAKTQQDTEDMIDLRMKLDDLEIISDIPEVPEEGTVMLYTKPAKRVDEGGVLVPLTSKEFIEEAEKYLVGQKVEIKGQYVGFPHTPNSPIVFGTIITGPKKGSDVYPFLAELEEIE